MNPKVLQFFEQYGIRKSFEQGEIIFHQGDPSDCVYYLESGLALAYTVLPSGRQKNLTFSWKGEMIHLSSYFLQIPGRCYAVAALPSTLLILSRERVEECMARIPAARDELIQSMARTLDTMYDKILDDTLYDSDARVARFICRYIRQRWTPEEGAFPSLPFSQTVIADVVGISRSRVNKSFRLFSEKGWLSVGYGRILVLDPVALEEYAFREGVV